jgi:hypothetical protein
MDAAATANLQLPGVYRRRIGGIVVAALGGGYLDAPYEVMRGIGSGDSPDFSVRPNGAVHQWRRDPPRTLSAGPGRMRAAWSGNRPGRSRVRKAALGG